MIKKTFVALVLACAACCAVPLMIPALAGASVFGWQVFHGPFSLDTILCATAPAALAFVAVYLAFRVYLTWKRKNKPARLQAASLQTACQTRGECGCKTDA